VVVAGTGFGKSLLFEGVVVCNPKKLLVVIAPLKAIFPIPLGF